MRLLPLALMPLCLLAGCAGYAADYWRPKVGIVTPQLTRYGLDSTQSQCVGERLARTLSVWQLRQLDEIARRIPQGHFGPAPLNVRDLLWAASHVRNPAVRQQLSAATESCGLTAEAIARRDAPPETTPEAAAARAPGAVIWLNLGAAPSGQAIAVDAASIVEEGTARQAWFRLTNPGESGPSSRSYLLRIDCPSRSLNSMGFRRYGAGGEIAEERDYRPAGEGVQPIDGGTVMEIAFLAMCT